MKSIQLSTFLCALLTWIECWKPCTAFETTTILGQTVHISLSKSPNSSNRPLVVIPGFAQSIVIYNQHLPTLSQCRDVILYQPRGTGRAPVDNYDDLSLPAQACALISVIDSVYDKQTAVDLAGFSMGGRIALATCCMYGDRVDKIHLTGVALRPSEEAEAQFHAWKELLRQDNLQGFAWCALLSSYGSAFLKQHKERLVLWVEQLEKSHNTQGLLKVLEQTHKDGWHVEQMVDELLTVNPSRIRLLVGADDRFATVDQVSALRDRLQRSSFASAPGCGHAVPLEAPKKWRTDVMTFLETAT
jgi:pimeloyl-ACP methyl ester carboxylesterase